jgi:hypothetical protein
MNYGTFHGYYTNIAKITFMEHKNRKQHETSQTHYENKIMNIIYYLINKMNHLLSNKYNM